MAGAVKLHDLIDLSMSQAAIADVLENIDGDFLWLDEILTECKNTFSTATVNLLPKTPSQKKPPRKRVKRRLTEELEKLQMVSESTEDTVPEPPTSTSETPVRCLRSTRSRTAQSSTSSRVSCNSKTTSKKSTEEKENVTEIKKNNGKTVKVTLASVSESKESPAKSPKPSTSCSSLSDSKNDEGKYGVRERARAYESMLSERNLGSPVTPKSASKDASQRDGKGTPESAGKETPNSSGRRTPKSANSESEPVKQAERKPEECDHEDPDIVNMSQHSQASSTSKRRSSKRISLKVLGSKARMRSLQGRLSVTGPCASFKKQTALESRRELATKQESLSLQAQTADPEAVSEVKTTEPDEEPQKNDEKGTKGRAPRTRLRLNKSNKSATDSADSASDCATEVDKRKYEETNKEAESSQTSTRIKRKKQKSLSSDDEAPEVKIIKESVCALESEVRTRTRTRAKNIETATSETTEGNLLQKAESDNLPSEATASNKTESVTSTNENGTRTRTRARKMEPRETTSSKDTISSEDAMDLEETTGSVFESPAPATKLSTRSSGELSDSLSAKSRSTTDSGIGPSTKSTGDNDNAQKIVMAQASSPSSLKPVKADSVAETDSKLALRKAEEVSRRETRVISRADVVLSQKDEEAGPSRSTRTKTRQEHNKNKDAEASKAQEEAEEPRMTRTKTRKRKAEEEAADTSASKRSCIETPPKADQQMDVDEVQEADNDSDYEDIEPDPPKRTVPSFLNQLRKSSLSRSTNLVSGVVTSFLKRNTPPRKPTFQYQQDQKKKELLQKEKREQERLNRLDAIKKSKAEEQKRKREERMRRAAEMREMRQKKEHDLKNHLAEKLRERLNSTEKMKEDKFKEEREKQRLRLKRQLEADERRRQEEEQRLKKLIEQQEEQKRQEELIQRKKEQEEQERQRRQAEERKRQEERLVEAQRQQQAEQERLHQQELERERERQKEKEQKEKTAAQERAERTRQEMEKRKERELKIHRDLEKLKEMQQQRLARMVAEDEEKRREEARLQQIIQQHNRDLQKIGGMNSTLTLSSSILAPATKAPSKTQLNADSYPITPVRQKKNGSMENYDINDLKSDDSTDDDENPRKRIPAWAQGANLKAHLINQVYHPPDLDSIFAYIEPPDLNEMFDRKRARFNKRTSSAVWNSPMHKSH